MNDIARAWYYSLLAGHYKNDGDTTFIDEELRKTHPGAAVEYLMHRGDFCFVVVTCDEVRVCFRGTHGKKGWLSNLRFSCNWLGFAKGFFDSFAPFAAEITAVVKQHPQKKVSISGHSRGGPFAMLAGFFAKQWADRYTKPILFCPPRSVNKKGLRILERVGLDALSILSYNDWVDNVGANGVFGKHVGKVVKLPRSREFTFLEKLKDLIPSWGHSYSEVTDGLVQYFYQRGMKREAEYLKSIRHLADC